MININKFKECFNWKVFGKTIAIVYSFEGDIDNGMSHFFIWKEKNLTRWIDAVYELHCLPLIIDVRTFVEKSINSSLPHIDYVLNLNTGAMNLSTMALIPSVCSAIGAICIPCNAVSIISGENKSISNSIAMSVGLNVPKEIDENEKNGIFRPINYGNSLGVSRFFNGSIEGIYQEFINGYDITTPIVFDPIAEQMDLLPTVMIIPETKDSEWFYGEQEKTKRTGFHFKLVELDAEIKKKYLQVVKVLGINTFCRIDARVKCSDSRYHILENNDVQFKDLFFIEINTMPTIRDNNSFNYAFDLAEKSSVNSCIIAYKSMVNAPTLQGFLLAISILSNA